MTKIKKQFKDFDFRFKLSWERLMDVLVELSNANDVDDVVPVVPVVEEFEIQVADEETVDFYNRLRAELEDKKEIKKQAKKVPQIKIIPEMRWGKEGLSIPLPKTFGELNDELTLLFFDFNYIVTDWHQGNFKIHFENRLLAEGHFLANSHLANGRGAIEIKNHGRVQSLASLYNLVYSRYTEFVNDYYGMATA